MPFALSNIPDRTQWMQELFDFGNTQAEQARTQQRGDAEVYEQAQRFQQQLEEKKRREAIEAALKTLEQTGQADPASASILKATPYGGMLGPGNALRKTPEEELYQRQRVEEQRARILAHQAAAKVSQQKFNTGQQQTQGLDQWGSQLTSGGDVEAQVIKAIQSRAISPDDGMRMLLQHRRDKALGEYRDSRPMPGALTANRVARNDEQDNIVAKLRVEIPDELQQAIDEGSKDPALAVAQKAVANQKQLGLSGQALNDYINLVYKYVKDQEDY